MTICTSRVSILKGVVLLKKFLTGAEVILFKGNRAEYCSLILINQLQI